MSRIHRIRILCLSLVAVLAVSGLVAGTAAAKQVKITGQKTTITPSAASKKFLADNGVTVSPVNGATVAGDGSVTLAITGGRVNAKTLFGTIRHKGGLKFSKGKGSAVLREFEIVNTRRGAGLTAKSAVRLCKRVNARGRGFGLRSRIVCRVVQQRILVARIANASKTTDSNSVTLKGDLKLSGEAAGLIDRALGTHVKAGSTLGSGESVVTYSVA